MKKNFKFWIFQVFVPLFPIKIALFSIFGGFSLEKIRYVEGDQFFMECSELSCTPNASIDTDKSTTLELELQEFKKKKFPSDAKCYTQLLEFQKGYKYTQLYKIVALFN